jgi:conserved oligomeric Golgi complex subunit 1
MVVEKERQREELVSQPSSSLPFSVKAVDDDEGNKSKEFSPQVMKAVEEIFATRSLKEVKEIEIRTRKEAEDKQEELRQIIGSSYKDAIANADDLVLMSKETEKLSKCIEEIKELVKTFSEFGLEETETASSSSSSTTNNNNNNNNNNKGEMDKELRDVLYAAGSRVKYLLDSPEQIWGYLEAGSCFEAVKRFGASKVILASLQDEMKTDERVFKTFPLITAQANALHSFAGQISRRSRLALQRVTDTPEQVASALCAIYVVEDIKEPKVMLQVLLQSRRAWVRANLRKLNSETDSLKLGKALGLIISEIRKTIRVARKLFVENDDREKGQEIIPLFFEILNQRPIEGNSQFSGVFEPTKEDKMWHEAISAREKSATPESKQNISSEIQKWLVDLAADAKARGKQVFEGLDKCSRVAEAERNANEMCEKIERANLKKLSGGSNSSSSSWSEFSLSFLEKDVNILTTLFEEPMLERGKTLLANTLAHVSARKSLNDALTDESILENIKDGEKTDFWLTEDSSNSSNIPGAPPGLRLARLLASKIDQSLKSARDDAMLLARQGGKSSSTYSSTANDEKRIKFLEPFVKEEAARGIVGFSSFLNEKVEEIKRDSAKRTHKKNIIVEKALLCGRLAHAIAEYSVELSLVLGPASEWYISNKASGGRMLSKQQSASNSNRILTETNEALISASDEAFKIWVDYASSLCVKDLEENLLSDDQLELNSVPYDWETISLGTSDNVTIELPVLPSSYVLEMMHKASRMISKAGGHLLSRRALKHFADTLGDSAVSAYANFLGLSNAAVPQKVQLINNTELSEKGKLQMLFDQRFVHDYLAGGVKSNATAPKLANLKAKLITQSLVKGLDPIDWATYEPYLWENEAKCYIRCSVLLGSFAQLYRLHKNVSSTASNKRTPTSSSSVTASETLRFSYLPVSLPALRGGSGRDAEKGQVEWGVIQNLKDESLEQKEHMFSKIGAGIANFF